MCFSFIFPPFEYYYIQNMMYTQLWKFQKYGILKVVIYYDETSNFTMY